MLNIPVALQGNPSRLASENHVGCTLVSADIPIIIAAVERARTTPWPGEYISRYLSHKLDKSAIVPDGMAGGIVRVGTKVTWMSSGGGAQAAVLHPREANSQTEGIIDLASVLGATLIGLKVLDRAALLRSDGKFDVTVVLNIEN